MCHDLHKKGNDTADEVTYKGVGDIEVNLLKEIELNRCIAFYTILSLVLLLLLKLLNGPTIFFILPTFSAVVSVCQ